MASGVRAAVALIGALIGAPASAQDDETYEEEPIAEEPIAEEQEELGEDPGGEDGGDSAPRGPWNPRPYIAPLGNIAVYSNGVDMDVGVIAGLEAGLRYARENGMLQGRTRLAGAGILTSGGFGYDVRGGTFMGVRPKFYGAEVGLDIFQNAYDGNAVTLAKTTGVDFPSLRVELGPQVFYLLGGLTPTWLGETSRQVIWSQTDAFGFGHEFEWRAGFSLNAGVRLSAVYYQRTLRAGTSQGLSVGLGIGF